MWASLSVLCLIPVSAGAVAWWRRAGRAEFVRLALLTLLGLTLAAPFLTHRAVGTGEAYNYSLAVADAVEQARQGTFPVWVGETDHAFNGRIHPLRTAVYFAHAAIGLDLLTGHTLTAWHLQNLLLALSLTGAAFSAYACLRALRVVSPNVALALAGLYATSPAWLNAAYGSDLYMTVTTAPFLPVAFLGAVLGARGQPWRGHLLLAVGLAATWLAHPPVAAWTTLACGLIVGANVLTRRTGIQDWASLASAAAVGLALIAWPVASALGLPGDSVATDTAGTRRALAEAIWRNTAGVSWQTLLPVDPASGALGNFQSGLTTLLLLAGAVIVFARTRERPLGGLLAAAAVCFTLTLPVPGLHRALWLTLPAAFSSLTNVWPMQRAYAVIAAAALFAIALAWPTLVNAGRHARPRGRLVATGLLVILALWPLSQAAVFVDHGLRLRASEHQSTQWNQRSNRSLTPISYAFFPLPARYENGPRDPRLDLRFFSADSPTEVIADNLTHAAAARTVAEGEFQIAEGSTSEIWRLSSAIRLEPGRRYRLRWAFRTTPIDGLLVVSGEQLGRHIPLTSPTTPGAFGMGQTQTPVLSLWVDGDTAETVRFAIVPSTKGPPSFDVFAHYVLEEVDVSKLPIRVQRLSPGLACTVDAPAAGWLETPRMYLPHYRATVDGRPAIPRRAQDGATWVPVPAGTHDILLEYTPSPGSRRAAAISLIAWPIALGLAAVALLRRSSTGLRTNLRPAWLALPVSAVFLAGSGWSLLVLTFPRNAPALPPSGGPLELTLALPIDSVGHSDPLFSSGRGSGSTTAFVRYDGPRSLRFGIDHWGEEPRLSPPITIDPSMPVTLRATSPLFYPPSALKNESVDARAWLESHTALWVNDSLVVSASSSPGFAPVAIARNITGSGSHSPEFRGVLVDARWLNMTDTVSPAPTRHALATQVGPLRLRLRLPMNETGIVDPIASWRDPATGRGFCFFVRYVDNEHFQLGIDGVDLPATETPPIAHHYEQPLDIEISHPALYPEAIDTPGYSAGQRALLRDRLRIGQAGTAPLSLPLPERVRATVGAADLRIGHNTVGAPLPRTEAHLTLEASRRVIPPDWPVPPGNLEPALDATAFGALELRLRFPIGATGRRQPLLTTGRAGEGTFIIVDYVDATHVRIGVDVWNKALLWSEPIACNYAEVQAVTIAHSALFPETSPAARSLPPAELRSLRETITVRVGETMAIRAALPAYDARPGEITPGESRIGGSNTEPAFTGELLCVSRLAAPTLPTK